MMLMLSVPQTSSSSSDAIPEAEPTCKNTRWHHDAYFLWMRIIEKEQINRLKSINHHPHESVVPLLVDEIVMVRSSLVLASMDGFRWREV